MPRRPAGHCFFKHTKQEVEKLGSRSRQTWHTYLANFPHLSKGKGRPKIQTSHTISGKIAHHSHTPKTHDKQNQTVRIFDFLAANPYPGYRADNSAPLSQDMKNTKCKQIRHKDRQNVNCKTKTDNSRAYTDGKMISEKSPQNIRHIS